MQMRKTIKHIIVVSAIILPVTPLCISGSTADRKITLQMQNTTILELVDILRARYRIPISFIEYDNVTHTSNERQLTINWQQRKIRDCMNDIVSQDPRYKFDIVEEHMVLYPDQAKYQDTTDYATNGKKDRVTALSEYVFTLWKHPGFRDLARPALMGSPRSPLYVDLVGISPRVSIITGFMQLLGNNPNVAVSIERHQWDHGRYEMRIKLVYVDPLSTQYLTSPVSIEVNDASMKDVVEYCRDKYLIPLSFIQSAQKEEKRYDVRYHEQLFDGVIYDVLRRYYTNYVAQLINRRFIIFPNDSVFQEKVAGIFTGPMEREAAAAALFNAIGNQYSIFKSYILAFSGVEQTGHAQGYVELKEGDSVIESIVRLLGNDYFYTFTITPTSATAWKVTFDSLER
jgi:hypothetical protein